MSFIHFLHFVWGVSLGVHHLRLRLPVCRRPVACVTAWVGWVYSALSASCQVRLTPAEQRALQISSTEHLELEHWISV